jgi:Dolichyl-phosphate-mannose-protein mannosyltransferase
MGKPDNRTRHVSNIIAAVFGLSLVALDTIRIFRVSMTFDEPHYAPDDGYLKLMRNSWGGANNHILHSVARRFFIHIFGENEFGYRLDSLIALCLFLVFSWLLCRLLFSNKWWQLSAFVLLSVVSPLIFEFWGLGRGYAMGLCFMTISIYYFIKYIKDGHSRLLIWAFLAAILSVYANFAYINYYISLSGVLIIQQLIFATRILKVRVTKEWSVLLVASLLLSFLVAAPLISTYGNGELSFLGKNGFIADTVHSLVKDGLFLPDAGPLSIVIIIKRAVVILTMVLAFSWLYIYLKKRSVPDGADFMEMKLGVTLFLLLAVAVVSMVAQHKFIKVNYLTDRTALFFIILFMLTLIYSLHYLRHRMPRISVALLAILIVIAGYNFTTNLSLHRTHLWWFNADDLKVLQKIADNPAKTGKLKVHVNWLFTPTFKYYISKKYPERIYPPDDKKMNNLGTDTSFDYYYISVSENADTLLRNYHKDADFLYGAFVLYKKN